MRRVARFLAVVVCAAALVPLPALSGHSGEGCQQAWTGARSCRIGFWGLPLTLYADAEAAPGVPVHVHSWVVVTGTPGPVLIECEAGGVEFVSCDDGIGTYPGTDAGFSLLGLTCFVEGSPGGLHLCGSGRGG